MRQPDVLWAFDDECGGVFIELVDMGLKPAVLGFLKVKGERIVKSVRSKPDVTVGASDDVWLEHALILGTDARVDPIAGDD